MNPNSWLLLCRTVRFGETDAEGVMHFPQLLGWCHESYEESLERFGLAASEIFPTYDSIPEAALPIVHCSADFRRPLVCGASIRIVLNPQRIDPSCFEVRYGFHSKEQEVATGLTRHLAIRREGRQRCELPVGINRWLEASSLQADIKNVWKING